MKSVRLDEYRAERLALAARREGISESEFLRRALDNALRASEGATLYDRLKDVIGSVEIGEDVTTDPGRIILEVLQERHARESR